MLYACSNLVTKKIIVKPGLKRASIWSRLGEKHEVPPNTQRSNLAVVLWVAPREDQPAKGERAGIETT